MKALADKLVPILTGPYTDRTRLMAGHILYRFPDKNISSYKDQIIPLSISEKEENIRSVVVGLLGQIADSSSLFALEDIYDRKPGQNVLIELARSLRQFDGQIASALAHKATFSTDPSVSIEASRYFIEKGSGLGVKEYLKWAQTDFLPDKTKANLLEAALRHVSPYKTQTKGAILYYLRGPSAKSLHRSGKSRLPECALGGPTATLLYTRMAKKR